ncbi:MAG: hypothetical protein H6R10_1374 [Rhodocyclaceae bacterium]|nr:hypothetical protein [Rhodocyclaceae bacterium]
MPWQQRGLIFKPEETRSWSRSHAQVPSALLLGDRIRLYYATRDELGRSRTSFIEVDAADPSRILYDHPYPVMDLGAPGTHDEDGVMVGSMLLEGREIWMYYTGWSRGGSVPYRVSCGLAVSRDGGLSFQRAFAGPVVDRTRYEPYMTMSPYVIKEDGLWKMWYGSGLSWTKVDNTWEPIYVIKYADSQDGRCWNQRNVLCIPQSHEFEANTRPSVLRRDNGYEMWFSYRHSVDFRDGAGAYRIGHATSTDGLVWTRQQDPADLQPTGAGWNSAMMAYPATIIANGRRFMFFNGNGFGRSGFGFAEWIE